MKKSYFFVLSLFIILGCSSSKKYLQNGRYDSAIKKSVKKLMKKPDDQSEIDILKRAYNLANQKSQDAINSLQYSGQPDIWESVFLHYDALRERQDIVERLPKNVLSQIGYEHEDYTRLSADAKNKAAKFFYAHAQNLLESNNKQDARKAYFELVKLQEFYPNYPNTRGLLDEAYFVGTNNVLFKIQNQTNMVMPEYFESELKKITLKNLNQQFLNFDTDENQDLYYDYYVLLNLNAIDVSPEQAKEIHYEETKLVRDGDKYVLDDNGNVKKDTLGNDVKEPNYVDIKCQIVENRLEKAAIVQGTLDFYDNHDGQLVKTFPITTENVFLYRFAKATGDLRALKDETKKIIDLRPVPFPTNLQMIYDTNEDLKAITLDIVRRNRGLLVN